jgi:hypothetical protein
MTEKIDRVVLFSRAQDACVWLHSFPSSNRWLVEVIVRASVKGARVIFYREREYSGTLPDTDTVLTDACLHGFVSKRPFSLGVSVDPSHYYCVLGLFLLFCAQHSLDALALMKEACSDGATPREVDPEFIWEQAQWEGIEPPSAWSPSSTRHLLDAMSEVGWDSLADLLEAKLSPLS